MSITTIDLPMSAIAEFCQRWQLSKFALFGSVLREDFGADSDIDIMVEFDPKAHPTFLNLEQMEAKLSSQFFIEKLT